MDNLRNLYQQIIIDHSQHPHNYRIIESPTNIKEGYNPLCGDKVIIYLKLRDDVIEDISFQGTGCAIATASASLMTDIVKNKKLVDVARLAASFQELVTTGHSSSADVLEKLMVLAGVGEFPMRVKCATLAWHVLRAAVAGNTTPVSTE